MKKEDIFPKFGGRIDVKGLDFRISDAPAAFAVRVTCAFRVLYSHSVQEIVKLLMVL